MKHLMRSLALLAVNAAVACSQTIPSYSSTADLSPVAPGALKFGLYGYDNPALLTYLRQPDAEFVWTDATGRWNDFNRWGLLVAGPNAGFGMVKTKAGGLSVTDYRFSTGFGDKTFGIGIAYGFSGGDKGAFDRSNLWAVGTLVRPDPHFSLGVVGSAATAGGRTEAAFDLGLRPLSEAWLTMFSDYAIQNGQTLRQGGWSYGAAVEALPGIRITGRYFDSHLVTLGVSVSLGRAGVSAASSFEKGGGHRFNAYGIRLGAYDRTVTRALEKDSKYMEMNLIGPMRYQRFILFDNANTLKGTLDAIDAAEADETVAGIAINTSGMSVNSEMLWELREQLRHFRSSGKKVVVFIDRPSMDDYRLATVADRIVLDPTGMILLPGYLFGGTYLKGTLEKLGIGYDEWRFFTYKSAAESLSRDSMSAADREQKQSYINDLYASTRRDICEGRRISPERFDQLVNDSTIFLARDAVAVGLVDTIGRWEEVRAMMEQLTGGRTTPIGAGALEKFNRPFDDHWGERPRIAVIYALGACAMDEGIRARSLVRDVEAASSDRTVKAIVLRVDSPGGDAMASDYIAEALRKAKGRKPVIVSQGYVAGSGGYWLSMYGDTIVAAPGTITGSIGVIGGWLYNKDFKEKLGMTTDHVQAGTHADLGFGARLPLIGLQLPDRNLTPSERASAERSMKISYAEFVQKVATGRKTTPEKIEPVAQGRFYSGTEGKNAGLVDVIGGLKDAISIARQKAGIAPGEEVTIIEMPKPGLFDFAQFIPRLFGIEQPMTTDPLIEQLRFRLRFNGQPMPLMPLGDEILQVPTE